MTWISGFGCPRSRNVSSERHLDEENRREAEHFSRSTTADQDQSAYLNLRADCDHVFHFRAFYISYQNSQPIYIYTYLVDLSNHSPLRQSLCNLSVEGAALPWIGKVFGFDNLGFPILLNERANHERIVVKRSAVNGGEQD